MYLVRSIDKDLQEWKNSSEIKPLLIRGVRQCGKTTSVRNLGKAFKTFVEINFEKEPSFSTVFNSDFDVSRICSEIELKSVVEVWC